MSKDSVPPQHRFPFILLLQLCFLWWKDPFTLHGYNKIVTFYSPHSTSDAVWGSYVYPRTKVNAVFYHAARARNQADQH